MKNSPFRTNHTRELDAMGESFVVTDLEGIVQYRNWVAEKLFRWHVDEVIGKNNVDVIPSSVF